MKYLGILISLIALTFYCGKDKDVSAGKKLFAEKTCVSCHGEDGKSQTPAGKAVKARDLTTAPLKQGESIEQIANSILNGVAGTAMVAWNATVSPEEAKEIAAFILSLRK